jgi:hypothetical protein
MANISVNVVNQNNVSIEVAPPIQNTINLTPPATQIISIDRGLIGPPGVPGESNIGGYPIALGGAPQNFDALMFVSGSWTNIPQTEIADGGNF